MNFLSAGGLMLLVVGCSVVEFPERLETLEREQRTLGDRLVGLDESVSELTTRYTALDSEASVLAERLDKVDAWVRRLGGRAGHTSPLPRGRRMSAPQPAVASRHLVRAGNETVIFDNDTEQRVMLRTTLGPGLSPDAQIVMRVLPEAGASSNVVAGLTSPERYTVPCGSRLVASASADLLLYVEAVSAGSC